MGKRKKETYYHRWLREHPRVSLYLNRSEYELLKRLADEEGISIKEVVVMSIRSIKEAYQRGLRDGENKAYDIFIDTPRTFYYKLLYRARERGIKSFEPALFTVPCMYCGKPVVLSHKSKYWSNRIKPELHEVFSNWYHVECEPKEEW